jgi:3-dehydroquinate synthase II
VANERILLEPKAASRSEREAIVERARRRGFHAFVLTSEPGAPAIAAGSDVVRAGDRLSIPGEGGPAAIVPVGTPSELEQALARTPDGGLLAIEWRGDRVIPLENAIAARRGRFRLWTFVGSVREAPAALGALEHGADRVIIAIHRPEEIDELESVLEAPTVHELTWVETEVRAVQPAGVGDRVLVDTTSLLRPEEGLLVGSAAAFLFLVASEAVGSSFSRARPFRVNAGAAHSYVLRPDGTTRYLSELEPGDAVLVAGPGTPRSVRVGRIKIERRPLVSVTVEDGGRARTVFLQEAETVRLATSTDRVAVTALAPGTRVRGVRLPAARHLGAAIEETIDER